VAALSSVALEGRVSSSATGTASSTSVQQQQQQQRRGIQTSPDGNGTPIFALLIKKIEQIIPDSP
jgi:hypothetical protein